MIFNEASVAAPALSIREVGPLLADVSRGMATLVRANCAARVLRLARPITEINCAVDGSMWDAIWAMQSQGTTRDEAVFLLRLSQKVPLLQDLPDDVTNRFRGCEAINPAGLPGEPLVLCAHTGGIAVSVPILEAWNRDQLIVRFEELSEDGDIEEVEDSVDNVARKVHATPILERHRAVAQADVAQSTLWQSRRVAYPNLQFGLDVEEHISGVAPSAFRTVLTRLQELDEAAAEWKGNDSPTPQWRSKVTPESDGTMTRYGRMREFRGSDGATHTFEWHARFGSGGRIHLRFDAHDRTIEVGYIGQKLPTLRYPT